MFENKKIHEKLKDVEKKISDQDNWKDHSLLNDLLKTKNSLNNFITTLEAFNIEFKNILELSLLAKEENNIDIFPELEQELKLIFENVNLLYIETLMSGKADLKNSFLEIHSGAGGTESQDWVEMILRMYSRWAESRKFNIDLIDKTDGDEAGLKSVTIKISGDRSYGWLKKETGVHRLVRISPFDSQKRRHTSFASVSCYPEIDSTIKINILEKDLRIDTYRASGAGGQHVNKTDSAVRITHIPTKISVQCQSNRSQHRNKAIAMDMLRSKLYEIELLKEEEKIKKDRGEKTEIGWGHQIRSYVMQPYQMVKDHRTSFEESNINSILDGKLDNLLKAQLLFFNH